MVTAICGIASDPSGPKPSCLKGTVEKILCNLIFCKEGPARWKTAFGTQGLVGVLEPCLGDIKVIVHQAVTGVTGIRKEYPNLTVFPFAQPAAVLSFYSNRMYSFFYEAGIINRQHGTLMVQLGCQKLLADVKDCRFIQRSTCKELLHGLDRFLI